MDLEIFVGIWSCVWTRSCFLFCTSQVVSPQTDIHKCPDAFKALCVSKRQNPFCQCLVSFFSVFGWIKESLSSRVDLWSQQCRIHAVKEIIALPGTAFCLDFQVMTSSPFLTVTFAIVLFGILFSCSWSQLWFWWTGFSGAQPSLLQWKKVFGVFFGRLMPALSSAR